MGNPDPNKIKLCLSKVHIWEKEHSRVDAYKRAITGSALTQEELKILRSALLIKDEEVL